MVSIIGRDGYTECRLLNYVSPLFLAKNLELNISIFKV